MRPNREEPSAGGLRDRRSACAHGRACGARTHTRWRLLWEQYASFSPDVRRPVRPGLAICASACLAAAAAAATAAAADTRLCGRGQLHPQKCEEEQLLVFQDVKLVMDLAHDLVDGVRGLHLCGAPPAALDDRDLEVRRHVDKPTQRTIWPGQKRTPALKPLTEILNTPSTARHNFASLPTL